MGAFWGFFGHLRRGDDLVSIDLLVGGISLGLCLLAGGPLALCVALVLLGLVGSESESSSRNARTSVARRRFSAGWPALRSWAVLMATAFAAGGWWELMMVYSYGGDFVV